MPRGFLILPLIDHMKAMCRLQETKWLWMRAQFPLKVKWVSERTIKINQQSLAWGFCSAELCKRLQIRFCSVFLKIGINPKLHLTKNDKIVTVLTESVVNKSNQKPTSGQHVYTDRYYSSPELATELLNINCFITGPVMMTNRVGMPGGLKTAHNHMQNVHMLLYDCKNQIRFGKINKRFKS